MQIALYARVSTTRHTQTIDQQFTRLRAHVRSTGGHSRSGTSTVMTATAAPASRALAWMPYEIGWPWPRLICCSSRRRIAWPATMSTRCCCWRSFNAVGVGSISGAPHESGSARSIALADPWSGRRIRTDAHCRADAARTVAEIADRLAASLDAGSLRVSHRPGPAPRSPRRPGRGRGSSGDCGGVCDVSGRDQSLCGLTTT